MYNLVKHLNSKLLRVGYLSSKNETGLKIVENDLLFNIFEIGSLNSGNSIESFDEIEYDNCPVHLDKLSHILDVKEFIDNPLIPLKIANKLRRFYVARTVLKPFIINQTNFRCVVINSKETKFNVDQYN